MESIDFTKAWVFLRQLILLIGGIPVVASLIDPQTLLQVVDAVGSVIPGIITAGTLVYGLFFSRPAKAADEVKGQAL